MATYDIKIIHGRVIDGTGTPAREVDIAIKDGKIVEVDADVRDPTFLLDQSRPPIACLE